MIQRARMLSVLAVVLAGAIGIISSTQTWLSVTLLDGSADTLPVPGADAVSVLAPMSLAALALGAALSIVGPVLRYVFGALALVIGATLTVLTARIVLNAPTDAAASSITEATGISGAESVAQLVDTVVVTAWPIVALVGWIVLAAAGVFILATAHRWTKSGRRYRTESDGANASESRPHDAIDSWDDLSRGADPTSRPG